VHNLLPKLIQILHQSFLNTGMLFDIIVDDSTHHHDHQLNIIRVAPTYLKEDLIIGQNEIVTNAVINRLAEQLWTNMQSLINYFDPDCEN
jgi:hypothetical protein